jgi:NAD(P)-dependent dehydrogenase (short-subunit alcohol dehydrogenase family)
MTRYTLAGRTVLITGSTGGLGAALATELRARGANLALFDLNAAAVATQAAALGGPDVARGWHADVRDLDSLQTATNAAADHFGGLDIVIANAGIDVMAPLATLEPAAYERVIDINLNGVWRTFRAGLPHVQPRQGYLLATCSMAAFVHSPLQTPYTASKAGVWALCNSLRLEVKHLGVGVGSLHPTFFSTPLMDDVLADPAGQLLWNNQAGLWKMIPLEDVVDGAVHMIEKRSDLLILPRVNTLIGRAPGLFRPLLERIGFRSERIERAIEAAHSSGWNPQVPAGRQ